MFSFLRHTESGSVSVEHVNSQTARVFDQSIFFTGIDAVLKQTYL